jgi:ABC-2 type transport system permease protein
MAKEFLQIVRDPLSLLMLLGVPTFMLLLYGYALSFDVRHVALGILDRSKTAESRDLVASFVHSTYFDQAADLLHDEEIERLFTRRIATAVLVIPEDYAEALRTRRGAVVQMLLNGSDALTAGTVLGYAQSIVNQANLEVAGDIFRAANLPLRPPIRYEPRVWYNPELRSTQFLVPGLIGFILMLTAVLSTALSIVREKERGTMEQLRVTSITPLQLIAGKTAPYLVISLIAMGIILTAARTLFGVAVRGPELHLFAATFLYLLGSLAFGILVSTLARTQAMAFQIGSLTSMLPTLFLSGFIFPIRNMPLLLQGVTYLFPGRYFITVIRGVMLKGAGLGPYPREMFFLALYTAIVTFLAYRRLKKDEG